MRDGQVAKFVDCSLIERRCRSYSPDYHTDGPTALPFALFGRQIPLRLMIVYWLTDMDESGIANYVYIPGSHRAGTIHPDLATVPERIVQCPAGSMSYSAPTGPKDPPAARRYPVQPNR